MNTSMKNKVQLIGNLGGDPELKDLSNGQHMLRLSLATNERFKGADGEWKEDVAVAPGGGVGQTGGAPVHTGQKG